MSMELGVFLTDRPLLFSIAYRMLGSASDAEDVLQDAWLRFQGADQSQIRSPIAFATTIVVRLCLDRLKSARAVREQYVGPWLPEPVLTSEVETPDTIVERAETVTLAFLVVLEMLTPEERAVFLLREVFEYDHAEIAGMLNTTVANSRQLLHRAKAHLAEGRRFPARETTATATERRALAEQFARALSSGDGPALTALLAQDVQMWSDGGGRVPAVRRPIAGRDEVVELLVGFHRAAQRTGVASEASLRVEDVNHEAAVLIRVGDRLESVFVLSVEAGVITALRVARNPDKIAHIARQLPD